jgi:phosphohistidine phosphatase
MPRLLLLRHAKSTWDDPGLVDYDRPLSARGRRSAPIMGRHMAAHQLLPDRVLCSAARRTRETFAGLLSYFDRDVDARITRQLYDVPASRLIDIVKRDGGEVKSLLVVGHNPSMQEAALSLIGSGNPAFVADITEKFPTAGLAVIDFDVKRFADIVAGSGRIVAFFRPRELEAVDGETAETDE